MALWIKSSLRKSWSRPSHYHRLMRLPNMSAWKMGLRKPRLCPIKTTPKRVRQFVKIVTLKSDLWREANPLRWTPQFSWCLGVVYSVHVCQISDFFSSQITSNYPDKAANAAAFIFARWQRYQLSIFGFLDRDDFIINFCVCGRLFWGRKCVRENQ